MQAPLTMNVLTVFQCTAITLAYFIAMVALPAWALRQRLSHFRLCERFMVYIIFGNFSVINIVFALELVHLSHPVTLAAAYLALLLWLRWHFYGTSLIKLGRDLLACAEKLAHRTLTWRQVWALRRIHPLRWLRTQLAGMLQELPSVILLVLLMANVVRVFGGYTLQHYGYVASDLPVHNYWINGLIDNQPFIGGVYPLGYHCVVYFLHEMTRIPVFVFLRVMGLVQTFYFMLTLVAFLRAVCRTRFVPFLGLVFFLVNTNVGYWRYIAGVPQEHGIIFILPCVWTAFKFFETFEAERRGVLDGSAPKLRARDALSSRWLLGFAMAESLTIAVHFYDFFALAMLLVGGACAYAARLVRPSCLGRVVAGGVAGVVIAALPMVIAFALGTPLQGSLNWGMNVLNGKGSDQHGETTEQVAGEEGSQQSASQARQEQVPQASSSSDAPSGGATSSGSSASSVQGAAPAPASPGILEKIRSLFEETASAIHWRVGGAYGATGELAGNVFTAFVGAMLVLALALWLLRERDYAGQIVTMAVGLVAFAILYLSAGLPWPSLMDGERTAIFIHYVVPAAVAMAVDGAVLVITRWMRHALARDSLSLAVLAALSCTALLVLGVQKVQLADRYEPDGNILCLERILREFPDFSWTIVSANEELRMSEDYGYHTEINEVLNGMEQRFRWSGTKDSFDYQILPADNNVFIPSEHVFFFIEKIPGKSNLEGEVPYGETISREWCENILPGLPNIGSYRGRNRFVEMSRLFYWAEAFQNRFPYEMRVFYEDEEMICWYLHQPEADYTDLSIDYGYNDRTARLMLEELTGEDPGELELGPDGELHTREFVNATRAGLGAKSDSSDDLATGSSAALESGSGTKQGEGAHAS